MNIVNLNDARREREARLIGLASAISVFSCSSYALERLFAGSPPHIREWAESVARDKYLLHEHYRDAVARFAAVARGESGDYPPNGWRRRKVDLRFHDEALEWAQRFLRDDIWTSVKGEATR
jgi:hypothetical protein